MTSRAPQKNSHYILKIDLKRLLQSKLSNLPGFLWGIQARYYTNNVKVIANHVFDGKMFMNCFLSWNKLQRQLDMSSGNYITLYATGGKFN